MAQEMTVERATEFGEVWNGRDLDDVMKYFTDDAVFYLSDAPQNVGKASVGKGEIGAAVLNLWRRFPDGQFTNLTVDVSGTFGRFTYDFVGTGPDGVRRTFPGFDVLEFKGDLVFRKLGFVGTVHLP